MLAEEITKILTNRYELEKDREEPREVTEIAKDEVDDNKQANDPSVLLEVCGFI